MVQAPVAPVDADGVAAAQVGTGVFVVLTGLCWWFAADLAVRGLGWWLWTCLVGAALGVLMIWFTRRRRARGDGDVRD